MHTIDFSTLTTGDILLSITSSEILNPNYHPFGGKGNLWMVERVDAGASSATLVSAGRSGIAHVLTVKDGETTIASVDGSAVLKPLKVMQSTIEEATAEGLFRRAEAESGLCQFLMFSHKNSLPHPVHFAIQKAYRAVVSESRPSTYLDNMGATWEGMQEVWSAAKDAYRRLNESDVKILDEMLTVARETVINIAGAMNAVELEYTPGAELSITHDMSESRYITREQTVTFREGATAYLHGTPHLIGRLTKTRAHLTNLKTHRESGYLTFTKTNGITFTRTNGGVTHISERSYKEIPASTEESVTAYLEMEKTVRTFTEDAYDTMHHLYQNIVTETGALESANDAYRNSYAGDTVKSLRYLHLLIANLEAAKGEITDKTEAVLWKLERLINSAYGM